MQTFDDITSANTALMSYVYGPMQKLKDQDLKDRIQGFAMSPSRVDAFVNTAELLYARSADIDDAGKDLAGALASFCSMNAWHGLGDGDNRGGKIAQAMRRELGETPPEGTSWPDPADDPAPLSQFAPPTAPAEPAEPA